MSGEPQLFPPVLRTEVRALWACSQCLPPSPSSAQAIDIQTSLYFAFLVRQLSFCLSERGVYLTQEPLERGGKCQGLHC